MVVAVSFGARRSSGRRPTRRWRSSSCRPAPGSWRSGPDWRSPRPGSRGCRRRPPRRLVAVGLALIVIGGVVFDLATPFPGTAALLPVAGAALVIAGGLRQPLEPLLAARGDPRRCAGSAASPTRCTCGTGRCSCCRRPPSARRCPGRSGSRSSASTFVLAEASRRWIEDPIRHGRISTLRPSPLAGRRRCDQPGGRRVRRSGLVASPPAGDGRRQLRGTSSSTCRRRCPTRAAPRAAPSAGATQPPCDTEPVVDPTLAPDGCRTRPGRPRPSLAAVRDDIPVIYADACHAEWRETQPPTCVYGEADSSTHGVPDRRFACRALVPHVRAAGDERAGGSSRSRSPPARWPTCPSTTRPQARVRRMRPMAGRGPRIASRDETPGAGRDLGQPDGPAVDRRHAGPIRPTGRTCGAPVSSASIRAIEQVADHVVVIGDTPNPLGDPPVCLSDHLDDALACATPMSKALALEGPRPSRRSAAETGATFIDPDAVAVPDRAVPGDHRARACIPRRPPHDDAVRAGPRAVPRAAPADPAGLTERRRSCCRSRRCRSSSASWWPPVTTTTVAAATFAVAALDVVCS